jgi:putative ABC transport system permease protein
MLSLGQDVRYAVRMLVRNPGFTAIAVAALALGIGANSAIFTVVNAVLLRPLKLPKPDQMIWVNERNLKAGFPQFSLSPGNYADFRDHNHSFSGFAAFSNQGLAMSDGDQPERLSGIRATTNFFDVLGVQPALGRTFLPNEMEITAPKVAVLSYGLWRRLGNSPDVLGRVLKLNREPYTVIGVMPAGFLFTDQIDVFIPLILPEEEWRQRGGHYLAGIARLKDGLTMAAALSDLNSIAARAEQDHPESNTGWDAKMTTLQQFLVGDFKNLLWMLSGAVGLVLLIACANVANLLLSRSAARRREIGIRSSLGAGSVRIIRQLLTESVLLASAGAAAGLALAWIATRLISRAAIETLPRATEIGIDWHVVAFTLAIAVLSGLCFGIAPALHLAKTNLSAAVKDGGHGASMGYRRNRLRSALVIGEVSLVLVLLTTSGLLMRSLYKQMDVNPGFDPHGVLTFRTELPEALYKTNQDQAAFYQRALERIRSLPGVTAAGASQIFPFAGGDYILTFEQIGKPKPAPGQEHSAAYYAATPGYVAAMRIPLKRGRDFTERDNASGAPVAMISEAMAREFYPGEDPLGKRIQMGNGSKPAEIVGIVGDVHDLDLTTSGRPAVYEPAAQIPFGGMIFAVRTSGEPESLISAVRAATREMDPELPLDAVGTVVSTIAKSVTVDRFATYLMLGFAASALALAIIGIYGVLSYAVAQATQEIGIRMALGAQPGDVLGLVLRHAGVLIGTGLAIGLVGAIAAGRALESELYEVKGTDPLIFGGMIAVLVATGFAACMLPALRAASVDPLTALRQE